MKFNRFFISNKEGKSNCVIRSLCKIYKKDYDTVYNELCNIAKELNCSLFNDIPVFETYMKRNNTNAIEDKKNIKIKDLNLANGNYIIFCWDKQDFYHMVAIIDNTLYDKDNKSLDLFTITIYKQNT